MCPELKNVLIPLCMCPQLKNELNCFDPAFFDEIEDLKYNHNEMVSAYSTSALSNIRNFYSNFQGAFSEIEALK